MNIIGQRVCCVRDYDPESNILSVFGCGTFEGVFEIKVRFEDIWNNYMDQLPLNKRPSMSREEAEKWVESRDANPVRNHARIKLDNGHTIWSFQCTLVIPKMYDLYNLDDDVNIIVVQPVPVEVEYISEKPTNL